MHIIISNVIKDIETNVCRFGLSNYHCTVNGSMIFKESAKSYLAKWDTNAKKMNLQQIKNNVDFSKTAYQTIGTYKGHGTGYAKVNDGTCILFDYNDEDIDEAQECEEYKKRLISDLCNFCAPKTSQFASLVPFMSEDEYTSIFDKFQSYYMAKATETVSRLFDEENGYIRSENGRKYLFTFITDTFID